MLALVLLIGVLGFAPAAEAKGTEITVHGSDFGRMLWAPGRQAIYMFENDGPDRSRCYGDCARAWPPVLTQGTAASRPRDRSGAARHHETPQRDRQVTYAGRPLYTYAHEGRGEVFCHNVDLNGGYWWVLDPEGQPRP